MCSTQWLLSECHPCPATLARSLQGGLCLPGWVGPRGWVSAPAPLGARPRIRPPGAAADFGKCPALGSPCHVCLLKTDSHQPGRNWRPPRLLNLSWLLCWGHTWGCPTLPLASSWSHLSRPSMSESESPWVVTFVTKRLPALG